MDTSFLFATLIDLLVSLVCPAIVAISMFILWRSLRRVGVEDRLPLRLLANGFGYLFLSFAVPFAIGLVAILLEDSADALSEFWFSVPAAFLTVVGAIYIALGTKRLAREIASGE